MKICGFHSGHEASYAILEDGVPVLHAELERYIREKEPFGDGLELLYKDYPEYKDIKYFTHTLCTWKGGIRERHPDTYKKMWKIISKNDGNFYAPGHHEAHAAAAFFSSNLDDALIITLDGGGREYYKGDVATCTITVWQGKGNKITPLARFLDSQVNIGAFWSSVTRDVMGLSVGHPKGHQAGTVMAMAAFGDPSEYTEPFMSLNPWKTDFSKYRRIVEIADNSDQIKFDIAAGLQKATEVGFKSFLTNMLREHPNRNLCLSGGVSLNSVMVGKIYDWVDIDQIYVDPVPYDGGLAIGAAQWVWHQELDKPRIYIDDNFTPYLGKEYSHEDRHNAINKYDNAFRETANIRYVCQKLDEGKIIAVYNGKSESGRRALGNRSILADPRSPGMKNTLNNRVKHRAWFRPFAPSILREDVKDWFTQDKDSPYMNLVLNFKEEVKSKVPAVVHEDGTARLQTVTYNDNPWYYNLLKEWKEVSGVPILLNTSFNDCEPIVETPEHAMDTFMKTDIDYLYFVEDQILVRKR